MHMSPCHATIHSLLIINFGKYIVNHMHSSETPRMCLLNHYCVSTLMFFDIQEINRSPLPHIFLPQFSTEKIQYRLAHSVSMPHSIPPSLIKSQRRQPQSGLVCLFIQVKLSGTNKQCTYRHDGWLISCFLKGNILPSSENPGERSENDV